LRPIEIGGIEIDVCQGCNGAWFDQFEVEAFLRTKRNLPDYIPHVLRQATDSELACPLCRKPMRTFLENSVFPFNIDMCPADKGYWFDGGELDQVAATVQKKTLRLKTADNSAEEKMQQQIARREVDRIQSKYANRYHPEEDAVTLENASFFDLSLAQKIVAFMGLPVESDRLYEWRSWMNLLIISANVAVFGVMMFMVGAVPALAGLFPKEWYLQYGLVPDRLTAAPLSAWYTLLTSMFMHGGFIHLFGNMFFLFTTGDDVEKRLGHVPFLFFYVAAGIAAHAVSVFTGNAPSIPHIGASGAIAGVMGAYLALCRHKSFYVWLFRMNVFGKMIAMSAWLYLVFWFGTQLLSLKFGNPGIDYWAHIGGFVFGFIAGKVVRSTQSFNGYTGQWEWRRIRRQS
jgi:membrane associated rhomboid family serine protease